MLLLHGFACDSPTRQASYPHLYLTNSNAACTRFVYKAGLLSTPNPPQWTKSCSNEPIEHARFVDLERCPICEAVNTYFHLASVRTPGSSVSSAERNSTAPFDLTDSSAGSVTSSEASSLASPQRVCTNAPHATEARNKAIMQAQHINDLQNPHAGGKTISISHESRMAKAAKEKKDNQRSESFHLDVKLLWDNYGIIMGVLSTMAEKSNKST